MTNAFPMLQRCFEAQWRGLAPADRDMIDAESHLIHTIRVTPDDVYEIHKYAEWRWPIWSVDTGTRLIDLVSFKTTLYYH